MLDEVKEQSIVQPWLTPAWKARVRMSSRRSPVLLLSVWRRAVPLDSELGSVGPRECRGRRGRPVISADRSYRRG